MTACRLILAAVALLSTGGAAAQPLRLAVASTLDNAGFAASLATNFAAAGSCTLAHITAGSAHALGLLERGDVGAALTHAPVDEQAFLAAAAGRQRLEFMTSEFVLAGPPADPAQVNGLTLAAAFARIVATESAFISRADGSGTHVMEQTLWHTATGTLPTRSAWYRETGGQSGAALHLAATVAAYTLTDRAVLTAMQAHGVDLELAVLAVDWPPRSNHYSLLLPATPLPCATAFATWLRSNAGRQAIASFELAGQPVYTPTP